MTRRASDEDPSVGWIGRLRALREQSQRWRGPLLAVATTVFVGGAVWSWQRLDLGLGDLVWWPLVLVGVVLIPATVAINALEVRAMGGLLDVTIRWRPALRIVMYATAANFLPVPGAAAVRIHALTSRGASLSRSTLVNVLAAVAWVSVALVVAAAAIIPDRPAIGAGFLASGLLSGALTLGMLQRHTDASGRWLNALWLAETLTVLGHAARLGLVLLALDQTATIRQVLVIGVNGPLAAAAGIFPSGLGLAEAIGAALATVVALAPAAGFAATALNRIVGLLATTPIAAALAIGERRHADVSELND